MHRHVEPAMPHAVHAASSRARPPRFVLEGPAPLVWDVDAATATVDRDRLFAQALAVADRAAGWSLAHQGDGVQVFRGTHARRPTLLVKSVGTIRCTPEEALACIEDPALHARWDVTTRKGRIDDTLLAATSTERAWLRADVNVLPWPMARRSFIRLHTRRRAAPHVIVQAYASIADAVSPAPPGVVRAWMGPSCDRFTALGPTLTRVERCQWLDLGGLLATSRVVELLAGLGAIGRTYRRDLVSLRRFIEAERRSNRRPPQVTGARGSPSRTPRLPKR